MSFDAKNQSVDLSGCVVIVTGAGSGIGASAAKLAASRGALLCVTDVEAAAAELVAKEIRSAGGQALARQVDVSLEDDVAAAVSATVAEFGDLTGIVNNAGIIVAKRAHETTADEWDRVMSVNAAGTFFGCKHAIRHFLAAGHGGAVVNIASISAQVGLAEQAAYCASKGAVLQLTKQLAVDYSHLNIRCNTVGPGSVVTPLLDAYISGQKDPAEAGRRIAAAHPIGRLAQPKEIA